jgi:hypothetical protein
VYSSLFSQGCSNPGLKLGNAFGVVESKRKLHKYSLDGRASLSLTVDLYSIDREFYCIDREFYFIHRGSTSPRPVIYTTDGIAQRH